MRKGKNTGYSHGVAHANMQRPPGTCRRKSFFGISLLTMNRAFGFTNGLRRSLRGAENQREDGVNETHSLESWQITEGGDGGQRGASGPPRDLTLRRSSMGDQGSVLAGKGVDGRMAPIAFSSSRGPPPGLGFKPITQDMSPEHGMFGQGANCPPAATTGNATMWARKPSNRGAQLTQEPSQTGTYTGTIGVGMQGAAPAP